MNASTQPRNDRLIGIATVADRLGYSQSTLRRLVRRGVLPVTRLTPRGTLRFRESDIARLIDTSETEEQ